MRIRFRHSMVILGSMLSLAGPQSVHSQVRLPKLPGQAQKPAADRQVPEFNEFTLEITTERIDKLIPALAAGKRLADGPNGPAALRARADQLDERQAAIYNKSGKEIEKWDEKKRAVQNCRDSTLTTISQMKRMNSAQDMQKMQQIGLAIAMAQSKGDTAEVRRLTEQFQKGQEPTPADTAAVIRKCGDPSPLGVVKEWADLKDQIDQLRNQASQVDAQIDKNETQASGMNGRQRAVFCERIKQLIKRLKTKQENVGFSDAEIEAAKKREQAIKDLEALCP